MKKFELKMLYGIYFIVIGMFLPWFKLYRYVEHFHGLEENVIHGYQLVTGKVILISAVIFFILIFILDYEKFKIKVLAAQSFFIAIITTLFFVDGIVKMFSRGIEQPQIGLLFVVVGCVLTIVGIRNSYKYEE